MTGALGMPPPSHPAAFSADWYSIFLDTIAPEQTEAEVAFVSRNLPLSSHPTVLDVCCASGRHAHELARRGYNVVGVDINDAVLERARAAAPSGATFHRLDMRELGSLSQRFDGVINLWCSFGYFDDDTNQAILETIAHLLRVGGRAVIDVYNRDHMQRLPPHERAVRGGVLVATQRTWHDNRLRVQLEYGTGATDRFEWRVYTPDEFTDACNAAGLHVVRSCAWFVEKLPPSMEHARMQFVLERSETA